MKSNSKFQRNRKNNFSSKDDDNNIRKGTNSYKASHYIKNNNIKNRNNQNIKNQK